VIVAGRQKSIAFFIALGAGLICVIILLYVGWVLLNWRHGILLVLGALLMTAIVSGVVLNTIFLVREIRRNAQHDAFINAVTHELKTPIASIRLYLETLQTRAVDEAKRLEFYRIMVDDSERLLGTIEQVLRTGRIGACSGCGHCTRFRRTAYSTNPVLRSPSWATRTKCRRRFRTSSTTR
jgi:signal transduction histidine kinase